MGKERSSGRTTMEHRKEMDDIKERNNRTSRKNVWNNHSERKPKKNSLVE